MKLTPEEIAKLTKKYNWWWRLPNSAWKFKEESFTTDETSSASGSKWKYGLERAAWRYELLRRTPQGAGMKPYSKLSKAEQDHCRLEFAGREEEVVRNGPTPGLHWDNELYVCFSDKEWNLSAPDEKLFEEFEKLIHQERTTRKLPRPNRQRWKKGKSPSWRWPELLDMRDREGRESAFSESEQTLCERAESYAQAIGGDWKNSMESEINS